MRTHLCQYPHPAIHRRGLQKGVAGHSMPVDTATGVAIGCGATADGKQRAMAGPTGAALAFAGLVAEPVAGVAQTGECMGGGIATGECMGGGTAAPLGVIIKLTV